MKRHLPQLDGLRTVAVGLVIAQHTSLLHAGYLGVDIFFVLSGYLITTILLQERDSGDWSLRRFYVRRLRRLYPALLVLLTVMLIAAPPLLIGTGLHRFLVVLVAGTYLSDVPTSIHLVWMGGLAHTWSLSIEEQFYLLWPLALKRLRGVLPVALMAIMSLAVLALGPGSFVYAPFARGGVLLIGCMLALGLRGGHVIRRPGLLAVVSLTTGTLVVMTAASAGMPGAGLASIAIGIATAGLIAGIIRSGLSARVLSLGPLVWLGRRSYGIYLWHVPIAYYLYHGWVTYTPPSIRTVGITAGGSIVLAAVSYRLVEQPFRSRRDGQHSRAVDENRGDIVDVVIPIPECVSGTG